MRKRKTKFGSISVIIISLSLISSACQKNPETPENKPESKAEAVAQPQASKAVAEKILQKTPLDVTKLADKPASEIDKIFGEPEEIKEIAIPKKGEYRLYKIVNEPKGLAVRFYGGRAKSFNLILSAPIATAKEALKKTFAIDVGNLPPTKDREEPLSEKWSGNFGGVKFSSVYAKREATAKGFVFVLAEVE